MQGTYGAVVEENSLFRFMREHWENGDSKWGNKNEDVVNAVYGAPGFGDRPYQKIDKKRKMVMKEQVKDFLVITGSTAIVAAAVFFFLVPSHVSVGSISGLAVVLENFISLPISVITMILNVALLIVGFLFIGREFGGKTVYTSFLLPVIIGILEKLFPNNGSMTGDPFLDMLCYVFVVSIGLSILFNCNASSGGLDIVAKMMNKYLRMDLGKAMALSGMCVALSSALVYDKKIVVLSVLGTYLNGLVLDHFIFGAKVKRRVCILSKKEEEIRKFIIEELHSGATIYEAIGAYDFQPHREIITIVDKHEYSKLMSYLMKTDREAFITVYTVNEIIYRPKS